MDGDLNQGALTTAQEAGLVACRSCGLVCAPNAARCTRCGERIESRDTHSLQRVWAYMIAGLIAYVPANLYPMLRTTQLFQTTDSTIVGGVVDLMHHGAYAIAAIVFIASVIIPVGKFLIIGYLAWLLSRPHARSPHRLHFLHEAVEFIGRWSMIDVFVVAILAALVQFDMLATINPGLAAVCFALSVVFTMLSAQAFDSRLIWDRAIPKGHHERH
ncbi:paraquat-inducible protein A [Fulvimarina sp. 2208YS6-2-32]|uniref:Paraquat-inducible protein A n=1 Tax=Fulvimarina uroteuthidis TaxID=3098149 RepID=A0ABU5I171_9HYPH|nr:paraquat-inducible protein A [Fulvimarina sp. 2208YS6-2-32]MDY8108820.1 paraquat-inducible protein A [Fulvimarina sp. 2208YS6-2-32]